jgi:transposase
VAPVPAPLGQPKLGLHRRDRPKYEDGPALRTQSDEPALCVASVPHDHWQSSTFIAALRAESITAPFLIDGAVNADVFTAYLEQVLCPELRCGDVVVLDNLSTHKIASVNALISARGATVRYLPPYSPDLNPIEMAFAKLKSHLRQAAARNSDDLLDALAHSLTSFRPTHCQGFFRHAHYASI